MDDFLLLMLGLVIFLVISACGMEKEVKMDVCSASMLSKKETLEMIKEELRNLESRNNQELSEILSVLINKKVPSKFHGS